MNTTTINATATATVTTARILEQTPARALTFLRTLSTQPAIRALMEGAGYTKKDHGEGWSLFFATAGDGSGSGTGTAAPVENPGQAALAEVEAWQAKGFTRVRAALRHLHPADEVVVFDGITAGKGDAAIASMALFLDRLDALDKAALATLKARGITADVREHLQSLVDTVVENDAVETAPAVDTSTKRMGDLQALYNWFQDWSDTARAVVTRRDQQIRLGIAKRRAPKAKQPAVPVPTVPVPVVTPEPAPASKAA